jgi:transglutaminase-like putative cysteine protease
MNSRRILLASSILSLCIIALGVAVSALLPQAKSDVRHFEFTYLVRVPKVPADAKTLRVWIPLPQSDPYQTISELKIQSPLPYTRHREPEYGNEYLHLETSAAKIQEPWEVQLRFHVARREHRVVLSGTASMPASGDDPPPEVARFLSPDRLVPIGGVIAALSEQETRGLKDPLKKARAIYNYVVSTMRYDKSGEGWGRGDAIFACTAKRGNCTDFHSLFIGMMRAAGIPARFEIGFPLPANQQEGAVPGYHCWAEFYLQPYGWIPVDASEAWKDPAKRDYFFGAHDVNRVQFTLGRDIRLDPSQQGEPLNYFVYPYAEVDGNPFTLESKSSFRDLARNAL